MKNKMKLNMDLISNNFHFIKFFIDYKWVSETIIDVDTNIPFVNLKRVKDQQT